MYRIMKEKKTGNKVYTLTFIAMISIFIISACHEKKKEIVKPKTYSNVMIDSKSGTQFQLDTSRIYITAINSSNDTIWKTDPWKDNNLGEYRVKRPKIIYFILGIDQISGKPAILISYDNSQSGGVDLETGAFIFHGQD